MKTTKKTISLKQTGAVLIISMIFVVMFSILAVSISILSGTNVQIAQNQREVDGARACAESGLEVIRYWLSRVSISGTTSTDERLNAIVSSLQNELTSDEITNITTSYNSTTLTIPDVTLDSVTGRSFSAVLTQIDNDTVKVDVTGKYGSTTRTIRINYLFGTRAHTVFDFGVASKGPLSLTGNIELEGVNVSVESSVYIESGDSLLALSITGNSQIAGDVSIANPSAYVDLQGGQAGIGGETGQDAIDNHVDFGVPPTEFPEPDPGYFESFVTGVVDSNTNTSADATYENVKILADTNPTFSGNITLKGVIFIETPNIVAFTGSTDIIGIVVGDGDWTDNSGSNQLSFLGNVESLPVTELPDEEQFIQLKNNTGTFIVAPGFQLSFGGNFSTLSGAIAGNGIEFFGNAGGTVNGSIINYSNEEMTLTGNSDLYFNRTGLEEVPAGFVPQIILEYDPGSYRELAL